MRSLDPTPIRRVIGAAFIVAMIGFGVIILDVWQGMGWKSYPCLGLVIVPPLAAMVFHNAWYARQH